MPTLAEEILMLLAEGAIRVLSFRSLFNFHWGFNYSACCKTVERLRQDGSIRRERRKGRVYLCITDHGRQFLENRRPRGRDPPKTWDRRWRLVIFDIPEKRKSDRFRIRQFLSTLGFARMQKSVWIAPHDFEERVQEFAHRIDIHSFVFQLTVERFRGLEERELASSLWDIRGLQGQYQTLIRTYAEKMAALPVSSEYAVILRRRFLNDLLWDYRSILAQDPQLPAGLLPADWSGETAEQFIDRCRGLLDSRSLQ